MTDKINLLDYDRKSLEAYFTEIGEKSFRAQQVLKWIYHQGIIDFDAMTNLSKSLRSKLKENVHIKLPKIISDQKSEDGTHKWLIEIDGGNSVETVFIPENDRGTLCISSQVGCPLECKFCSTGQQGFNRNLTASEIIGQVWAANKSLGYFKNDKRIITNIVFMGMGEPLLNYDNVLKAINLLTDDLGFGLARRRVTVSTSGIIPEIDRLKEDTNVSLAISLHASNNELRNDIVPINRSYPMQDLLSACKRFTEARDNEPITIEYVMLKNVNDSKQDAYDLVDCLHGIPAKVNLIPFNTFPGTNYNCSEIKTINAFRDILVKSNIITITRKTRGDDIDAACGQLVGKVMAKAERHKKIQVELNS
ncbi:MAG: 23S rRNA (adenine(2503)-C(2))-methyltransferase RlmN [Pseudomonadota bacterium]